MEFLIKYKNSIKSVLINQEDFYLLSQYKWRIFKGTSTFYVIAHTPMIKDKRKTIRLHNEILKINFVDHKNGNGLDNRRENLRASNHTLNAQNRHKLRPNKQSKYKGVIRNKQVLTKITWIARIKVNGKQIHLGSFNNELDAAKAYNKAALKYFGEYASLNNLEVSNRIL